VYINHYLFNLIDLNILNLTPTSIEGGVKEA